MTKNEYNSIMAEIESENRHNDNADFLPIEFMKYFYDYFPSLCEYDCDLYQDMRDVKIIFQRKVANSPSILVFTFMKSYVDKCPLVIYEVRNNGYRSTAGAIDNTKDEVSSQAMTEIAHKMASLVYNFYNQPWKI